MESSSVRMENALTISWCVIKTMTVTMSQMKLSAVSGMLTLKSLQKSILHVHVKNYEDAKHANL